MARFWFWICVALTALLGLSYCSRHAKAHEAWWNGKEVDPQTKRYCCGDNDVKHLTREDVTVVPGGYRLNDTGEIIATSRTQPSPDGEFWVFRWGNPKQTQCFFAPVDGV